MEAQHSQNILRTGQIFGVIFDRADTGGVYMRCENGHVLDGKELEIGLEITHSARAKEGKEKVALDHYAEGSVQKMWSAKISNVWINIPVRDEKGFILKDERVELGRDTLLQDF